MQDELQIRRFFQNIRGELRAAPARDCSVRASDHTLKFLLVIAVGFIPDKLRFLPKQPDCFFVECFFLIGFVEQHCNFHLLISSFIAVL